MLTAFLAACLIAPVVLLVGYYLVLPAIMLEGYRRSMHADRFQSADGSQGAGSVDLAYFTLYYDAQRQDILISGKAPVARHWQFGAFDGMTRLVGGAYVNQKTVELGADGEFSLRVTARPQAPDARNVLDVSSCPRGMIVFRVLLPESEIVLPTIALVARTP